VALTDRLTHPATMAASIWSRGTLHPMPVGTLMGVPPNPAVSLAVLDPTEIAWAEGERDRPMDPTLEDLSVGEFVTARVGSAVVDRLVEPFLGGVYAGHAHHLSLQATMLQLWAAAQAGESVTAAAERAFSMASPGRMQVFAGVVGGVATLVEKLVSSLVAQRVQVNSSAVVRELDRNSVEARPCWALTSGPVPAPTVQQADALVIAVPAAPAARLLAPHAPDPARDLGTITYASMAILSVALPPKGCRSLPDRGSPWRRWMAGQSRRRRSPPTGGPGR